MVRGIWCRDLCSRTGKRFAAKVCGLGATRPVVLPTARPLPGGVVYVNLPELIVDGTHSKRADLYARAVKGTLNENNCGYIVDVRGDGGGNLVAMLQAIAPILGPGPAVRYADRLGRVEVDEFDGDGHIRVAAAAARPPLGPLRRPVAVLTGPNTASAGEGVVLAFHHRPSAVTIGTPTYGTPTGNQSVALPDGGRLKLTIGVGVDAQGELHSTALIPDIPVAGSYDADTLNAAQAWLSQHGCGPI